MDVNSNPMTYDSRVGSDPEDEPRIGGCLWSGYRGLKILKLP